MTVRRQQVKVAHHTDGTKHQHIPGESTDNTTSNDNGIRIAGKISTKASRTEINVTVTMITVAACFAILLFPSYLIGLMQIYFQVGYAFVTTRAVEYDHSISCTFRIFLDSQC